LSGITPLLQAQPWPVITDAGSGKLDSRFHRVPQFQPILDVREPETAVALALFARIFEYLDLSVEVDDPAAGRVTIDGIDLRDLRLTDLARVVGVVSQETYLLHTTVRENLRYAKPDATDAEIEEAARAAQVHDLIVGLPEGYDTMVGSRGHRFSGGEKQRIAIARTLLRDPKVLVLDEATSALDTETERAVQRAFDALAVGRTTITIAHRLSTVRDADQIVVIDHGRAIESGTHTSLVAGNGRYAKLAA
jgi:ATP-binding cassette, subfamily B, bacterial